MRKPLLVIVNGLPGAGKTTLARRLGADTRLPVFSRDRIFETLHDGLEGASDEISARLGAASFALLYHITGRLLAAGQPLLIEGFFGRPELRGAEFLQLQRTYDFEPLQILCKADGQILLERFLARVESVERHAGHSDLAWLEDNKERLLQGELAPMALGGQVIEIDTTTLDSFEYDSLLQRVREALTNVSRI